VARKYSVLSQDEQDEIIVNTVLAQERDHFSHELNIQRYSDMLAAMPADRGNPAVRDDDPSLTPAQKFRRRMESLVASEQVALEQVTLILDKTSAQLPSTANINAAKARIQAKE
jgi:hypothetical protein